VIDIDILIMSDSWQEEPLDVATVKLEELATEERKLHLNRYILIWKIVVIYIFVFVLVSYSR
jgi:hypothetical protein